MKLRLLSIAAALLAASTSSTALAQIGIYGKFSGVHLPSSVATSSYASGWFKGPGGGVYFNLVHLGPISLGGDVRGDYLYQSSQHYRDLLLGVRIGAKAPLIPIRPYVQFSAGLGGSSRLVFNGNTFHTVNTSKFQYWIIGGIDHTVLPHIDWRVVDLGYGHMAGTSGGVSVSGANMFTLGTGVVVRLP